MRIRTHLCTYNPSVHICLFYFPEIDADEDNNEKCNKFKPYFSCIQKAFRKVLIYIVWKCQALTFGHIGSYELIIIFAFSTVPVVESNIRTWWWYHRKDQEYSDFWVKIWLPAHVNMHWGDTNEVTGPNKTELNPLTEMILNNMKYKKQT